MYIACDLNATYSIVNMNKQELQQEPGAKQIDIPYFLS